MFEFEVTKHHPEGPWSANLIYPELDLPSGCGMLISDAVGAFLLRNRRQFGLTIKVLDKPTGTTETIGPEDTPRAFAFDGMVKFP